MRSDSFCTANTEHRLVTISSWCGDCSRWHFRQRLEQRSGPSSKQWQTVERQEWDHTPEMDDYGWTLGREFQVAVRDLQRLYVEHAAGIQRLF